MRKNWGRMSGKLIKAGFVAEDHTSTYFQDQFLQGQIFEQTSLKLQITERQLSTHNVDTA
jgi:hypothetical protein